MFTAMASASSNDPGWPASALGVVGLVAVLVCVLAWVYRGTVEGEGDGLMPWFNGVPGWVGLTLAVIGFGCVAAGGYGYYVQDKEFLGRPVLRGRIRHHGPCPAPAADSLAILDS